MDHDARSLGAEPAGELLVTGQASWNHFSEVNHAVGVLTAERQHCGQIVLQLALGGVAGFASRDVRPSIAEEEFTGENVIQVAAGAAAQ